MNHRAACAVGLLWLLTSLQAFALPDPLADGLRRCAREKDQTARLACFDALANSLPRVEADQFGLTNEIARKREAKPAQPAESPVLPGTIVALRRAPRGEWIFTLDNQQVWIQTQVESKVSFEVGDAVRIEHGAMGSLWLAADKARKTRVRRIS